VGLHEHDGIGEAFTSKGELSRVLVDFQGGGSQMLEFVTKLELGSGSPMPEDGMLDSMSPNKRYLLSMLSESFQKHELLLRPATAWTRRHVRTTASTLDLTCRRRISGSGAIPSSDSNAASLILSPSRWPPLVSCHLFSIFHPQYHAFIPDVILPAVVRDSASPLPCRPSRDLVIHLF
jgi:hypothetical protein